MLPVACIIGTIFIDRSLKLGSSKLREHGVCMVILIYSDLSLMWNLKRSAKGMCSHS